MRSVVLGDLTFAVQDEGEGSPVVLLHGFPLLLGAALLESRGHVGLALHRCPNMRGGSARRHRSAGVGCN